MCKRTRGLDAGNVNVHTRPLAFLLVAVFTDVRRLIVWEYKICYAFIIFIRLRMAENNQRHLSHGFNNILVGDRGPNMHYVVFFCCKSGTTNIWGGAFAPPAPPWLVMMLLACG